MNNEKLNELFSKNLKKWLSINGKTQADLVRYIHVSSATVSDWCNGRKMPRADKLQIICSWLGITMSDLMEENEEVPKTGQQTGYYFDEETAKLAQELKDNPELRILLDASRGTTPEEMRAIAAMIKTMKGNRE